MSEKVERVREKTENNTYVFFVMCCSLRITRKEVNVSINRFIIRNSSWHMPILYIVKILSFTRYEVCVYVFFRFENSSQLDQKWKSCKFRKEECRKCIFVAIKIILKKMTSGSIKLYFSYGVIIYMDRRSRSPAGKKENKGGL